MPTTATKTQQRAAQITMLLKRGHHPNAVAVILGMTPGGVRMAKHRAQKLGAIFKPNRNEELLAPLPDPIIEWLDNITPIGCSVSDTILAIITDAYHDDCATCPDNHKDT